MWNFDEFHCPDSAFRHPMTLDKLRIPREISSTKDASISAKVKSWNWVREIYRDVNFAEAMRHVRLKGLFQAVLELWKTHDHLTFCRVKRFPTPLHFVLYYVFD